MRIKLIENPNEAARDQFPVLLANSETGEVIEDCFRFQVTFGIAGHPQLQADFYVTKEDIGDLAHLARRYSFETKQANPKEEAA